MLCGTLNKVNKYVTNSSVTLSLQFISCIRSLIFSLDLIFENMQYSLFFLLRYLPSNYNDTKNNKKMKKKGSVDLL